MECNCGNDKFGFDCVCEWVAEHPGNTDFTCEFCGIYEAALPRCNKCEHEYHDELDVLVAGLITCKYCGNPFDMQFQHTTCGLE